MRWFNKNEDVTEVKKAQQMCDRISIPLPANSSVNMSDIYQFTAWRSFCDVESRDVARVVWWEKICLDYYKAVLDDSTVIFYDYAENWARRLNAEQAKFKTEEEWRKEFGRRLAIAMNRAGVNQLILSERMNISQSSLSYYMAGKKLPSAYMVGRLAEVLNCSSDFLTMRT